MAGIQAGARRQQVPAKADGVKDRATGIHIPGGGTPARRGVRYDPSSTSASPGIRVSSIVSISKLGKTYASGFQALKSVDLEIRKGEILALLGPNGAGKTTLISIICGIVNPSSGTVLADGHDIVRDYRA